MIDTHCHVFKEDYENIEEVILKMKNNIMIVNGTGDQTNREVIDLCNHYSWVYGAIGIHPEELNKVNQKSLVFIEENITLPKIVAIGEIGLDYHYTKENKEEQKELFIKQIQIAQKYHKPIIVHSRDASQDTYEILRDYGQGLSIDIHCFSGSIEMAKLYIALGCRLGIGGVVTFKNSKNLITVVKELPLENFLLETDSPYLTPEPFRGTKNEPYHVYDVAKKIAEIKELPLEIVLKETTNNAITQFDLPRDLC